MNSLSFRTDRLSLLIFMLLTMTMRYDTALYWKNANYYIVV